MALTRIILPQCCVFVIFVDNFNSIDLLLSQLIQWTILDIFLNLPKNIQLRLILVFSISNEVYNQQVI